MYHGRGGREFHYAHWAVLSIHKAPDKCQLAFGKPEFHKLPGEPLGEPYHSPTTPVLTQPNTSLLNLTTAAVTF